MAEIKQITMFEQEFASKEEKLFNYYVNEMIEHGYLKEAIYQPESFELAEDATVFAYEKKKNANEIIYLKLARAKSYTADWRLIWTEKAEGIFCWHEAGIYKVGFYPYRKARADNFIPFFARGGVSYVDVKGGFVGRSNTSGITFPVIQKWLLTKDIFIQKVVASLDSKGIFQRTFTPRNIIRDERYKKDYKEFKAGDSKIKFIPTLIEHFVKNKSVI